MFRADPVLPVASITADEVGASVIDRWPKHSRSGPVRYETSRRTHVDQDLDNDKVNAALDKILMAELSGVVRYTHYSLVITGPNRIPLVDFMKAQAAESLLHAQQVGEILSGLGGHPSASIDSIEETHNHSIENVLSESLDHERHATQLYKDLLAEVEGRSIFLEEYARGQVEAEEQHQLELMMMLRDYAQN